MASDNDGTMTYDEYASLCAEAAKLDESGKTIEALAIFEGLAAAPISAIDRSLMWQNVGTLLEKLGRVDEALAAYATGAALEKPLMRFAVTEHHAAGLHRAGRNAEALAIYREMVKAPWATEYDRYRCIHNIATLGG
jgi:tetratricopeptide (TPR) repeat protein